MRGFVRAGPTYGHTSSEPFKYTKLIDIGQDVVGQSHTRNIVVVGVRAQRDNASVPATTKRPHFIPRVYLRAWADERGQVSIRRRERPAAHTVSIDKVAVDRGIYGRGEVGQRREDLFGKVEESWADLRDELITTGIAASADRRSIALFIALQLARTREHVARQEFVLSLAESTTERPLSKEAVRQYLTHEHLGFAPDDREVEGAWTVASYMLAQGDLPTREALLGISLDIAVSQLAPAIEAMWWSVVTCRKPILLTSDRPVMYWRTPSDRDDIEGVGLLGAVEVRFPLTPRSLLVLRPVRVTPSVQRVDAERFDAVNRTTGAQCFEFILGTATQQQRLAGLTLDRRRPSLRFDLGPLYQQGTDGRDEPFGDVVHTWIPSPSR